MGSAGDGWSKTARIVARSDRPCVFLRIEFEVHANLLRLEPKHVGDHLAESGAMALPLRGRGGMDADPADWVDRNRGRSMGAVLRARLATLGRRHHGRDIAHVRDRWLDDSRE